MALSPEDRFRSLYEAEVIGLLGYAARRLVRADDAADVVADVFTVAWRRLDDVPLGAAARPWLFGVARNVLNNSRRGAARNVRLTDRLRGELRLMSASAEARMATTDHVRRALGRLSPDDRELLLLTNWEGLSPADVALAMGIPGGTVRSRLHRARQQLRRELDADDAVRSDSARPRPTPISERTAATGQVHTGGRPPETNSEDIT